MSKVVVALDPPPKVEPESWVKERVNYLCELVSSFKVGLPLVLRTGVSSLRNLFSVCSKPLIADLKLADIGDIMSYVVEVLADAGVNAVISHAFVGRRGALDLLVMKSKELGIKPILVVSMSHQGSTEFIDKHLSEFVNVALELRVWGVVAPATRKEVIGRVRELAGSELRIFSPGVGAQGAEPGSAICSGADYEIVGRAVTNSPNPREALQKIIYEQEKRVRECRS
ncbi:MAG: orotidine-5'-phosphate decarboxylase [Desulfurococcaceae archaeon TW002]